MSLIPSAPFKADLSADSQRFIAHCKWLLSQQNCGLAVFGTNSEANSLSMEEAFNAARLAGRGRGLRRQKQMVGG
jgi:dihydrodipicolinate synthase/N-acetylneuraminate lyase